MRIALTVQYNGRDFHGFSRQPGLRTVQGAIESALHTILRESVRIYASGRTDTGVSAQGQVIHFESRSDPDLSVLIKSLNAILPVSISVSYGAFVPDSFHARFSCLSREYLYLICNHTQPMAVFRPVSCWIRKPLDTGCMQQAANHLIGEHDFATFTRRELLNSGEKTVREVYSIDVIRRGSLIWIHYSATGYLHNMIRIITGTLIETGSGLRSPDSMPALLRSGDRTLAGKTVSPHPLTFLNAHYPDYRTPVDLIPQYEILGLRRNFPEAEIRGVS